MENCKREHADCRITKAQSKFCGVWSNCQANTLKPLISRLVCLFYFPTTRDKVQPQRARLLGDSNGQGCPGNLSRDLHHCSYHMGLFSNFLSTRRSSSNWKYKQQIRFQTAFDFSNIYSVIFLYVGSSYIRGLFIFRHYP